MLIYIYGEDSFRSRQYLKEQVAKFKIARDPQGYNVVFVNAKTVEVGKVMSEIVSAPFLAEKRMVVLENVLSVSDKELLGQLIERVNGVIPAPDRGRGQAPAGIRDLKGQIPASAGMTIKQGFPESNIIVFYQSEPLSKVKEAKELHELLRKEKYAKEFELLHGDKLYGWAAAEIKNRDGKISRAALTFLCDNIAGDMWHLNTLLDQLSAYKKEEIQLADIQLFLEEKLDDNIFNLTDAIVAGNKKLAFKLLDSQRKLGAEDGQIFGTILWQFRTLISMRDLFEREDISSSDILAKKLKIHPFVARKNWTVVKKYSLDKLQKIYRELLEIDIKTKTGLADQSVLLDLFVGRA